MNRLIQSKNTTILPVLIGMTLGFFALLQSTALAETDLPHPLYTWSLSPTNNDWNTPANWMPVGVPDTISEGAVFGSSSVTDIVANAVVHSIEFNPGASQYTITGNLTFNGGGVINNSGVVQTFNGTFGFDKSGTTAGSLVTFTTTNTVFGKGTSAGSATYINNGIISFSGGLRTVWYTTAAEATIVNNGQIYFHKADAGSATITNNGGFIRFGKSSAASSTIINDGGPIPCGGTARLLFDNSVADSATLIANGHVGCGAGIRFVDRSSGDSARIELFGIGHLDVSSTDPISDTVGSIEGNGLVFLGSSSLSVGSNNLNTTFAGTISDRGGVNDGTGGSITKTGTGTLILSNANTYTGGTVINGGALVVTNTRGSGTGTGAVEAAAGTLGGTGTIAGAVTVGTGSGSGATLSPGTSVDNLSALTIQSELTFESDGICQVELDSTTTDSNEIVASGVTINSTAQFSVTDLGSSTLPAGTVFSIINNTAGTPIAGTFSNLPDGSILPVGSNEFQASYEGGDGNDLTLTVVP